MNPRDQARVATGGLIVDFQDVLRASERIGTHVARTPAYRYPLLDAALGTEVWVKHENQQMIGCFKARGAINAILATEEPFEGVVASSSGNHGQGVAYAARMVGRSALIIVPEWAQPHKVDAIRSLGATVEYFGDTSDDGRVRARQLAGERDLLLLDDFCNPLIIAGNGTVALEFLEQQPDLDVLVIPLGGGALAAGCGVAARAMRPQLRVITGQSASCPATSLSWRAHVPVEHACSTIADGLAVNLPHEDVVALLVATVDDVSLVAEPEISDAVGLLIRATHNLVEPSGAVPVAVCRQRAAEFAGLRIGVIATGSNISAEALGHALGGLT